MRLMRYCGHQTEERGLAENLAMLERKRMCPDCAIRCAKAFLATFGDTLPEPIKWPDVNAVRRANIICAFHEAREHMADPGRHDKVFGELMRWIAGWGDQEIQAMYRMYPGQLIDEFGKRKITGRL